MRAVTFQAPGEVRVEDVPEPAAQRPPGRARADRGERACAARTCTSTTAACRSSRASRSATSSSARCSPLGSDVERAAVGDRVLGCFHTACGTCWPAVRGDYHRCLPGARSATARRSATCRARRPSRCWCRNANLTLRRVPEGMTDETALFAGDVMGTGYHASRTPACAPGDTVAVLGLGPVGLCAVQAARATGAAQVFAIDTVAAAAGDGRGLRRHAVHLTEGDPSASSRARPKAAASTSWSTRSATPRRCELAISLARDAGTVSGDRRLRRARRGAARAGLAEGPHDPPGPRERDRPRRPRAGDDVGRPARPVAAGHAPHEPRGGAPRPMRCMTGARR